MNVEVVLAMLMPHAQMSMDHTLASVTLAFLAMDGIAQVRHGICNWWLCVWFMFVSSANLTCFEVAAYNQVQIC